MKGGVGGGEPTKNPPDDFCSAAYAKERSLPVPRRLLVTSCCPLFCCLWCESRLFNGKEPGWFLLPATGEMSWASAANGRESGDADVQLHHKSCSGPSRGSVLPCTALLSRLVLAQALCVSIRAANFAVLPARGCRRGASLLPASPRRCSAAALGCLIPSNPPQNPQEEPFVATGLFLMLGGGGTHRGGGAHTVFRR